MIDTMNESANTEVTLEKGCYELSEELLYYSPLSLDLVSALAGDRPLAETEYEILDKIKNEQGNKFFSDLLYTITHRFFLPEVAEDLWNKILRHKYEMSDIMKRNIRIAVASLDYLSNLTMELHSATLSDESYIADLISLTMHDGLTGLFNHSSCFRMIDTELIRFTRYNTDVSLAMIDVDNFKKINDTLGHQTGDNVLTTMATIIKEEARESDICCRYGGDEFVVIMEEGDGKHRRGIMRGNRNHGAGIYTKGGRRIVFGKKKREEPGKSKRERMISGSLRKKGAHYEPAGPGNEY
jgi:GGDEF domain-containing protein